MSNKIFYHLTEQKNLEEILKTGLIPKIGPRSSAVLEEDEAIYISDKNSLPYWNVILNLHTILCIRIPAEIAKDLTKFCYGCYDEWQCRIPIPAEWISVYKKPVELPKDRLEILALGYLDTVSYLCRLFARQVTWAEACYQEEIQILATELLDILPRLNIQDIPYKTVKKYLVANGENGEYTLCDIFDVDDVCNGMQLWKILGLHETATAATKAIYEYLKTLFKSKLKNIDTGGFTG